MDGEAYTKGLKYEFFIRRALKSKQDFSKGADVSYMRNLINTENGMDLSRLVGSHEKQLEKIRKFMDKALDKYLKLKLTAEERLILERLKEELTYSFDSEALMAIVNEGLEATQRFKEH